MVRGITLSGGVTNTLVLNDWVGADLSPSLILPPRLVCAGGRRQAEGQQNNRGRVHVTLFQAKFIPLPSRGWILRPRHLCYVARNSCPQTSSGDQRAIIEVSGQAGRGREWQESQATRPRFSTTGPLSRRHSRGLRRKGRGKAHREPCTDPAIHRRASAGLWEQQSQFLQILQPATAASDSGGRLCGLREFPIPSPGLRPSRHYLG